MSGSRGSKKSKKQRVDELTSCNPLVDEAQIREAGRLLESLENEGVQRRGYGIASPYDRTGVRQYTRHHA